MIKYGGFMKDKIDRLTLQVVETNKRWESPHILMMLGLLSTIPFQGGVGVPIVIAVGGSVYSAIILSTAWAAFMVDDFDWTGEGVPEAFALAGLILASGSVLTLVVVLASYFAAIAGVFVADRIGLWLRKAKVRSAP